MYSHDGGPVLLHPPPPPPPPPPPLCSFVHIVPQYTMVQYPPQASPLQVPPQRPRLYTNAGSSGSMPDRGRKITPMPDRCLYTMVRCNQYWKIRTMVYWKIRHRFRIVPCRFHHRQNYGIDPEDFADGFHRSGLACGRLAWTAFSGSYDFAYLAKVLTGGQPLPATLDGFLALVRQLFGPNVLDVKHLARCCAMRGGLEQVAAALGVERAAGRAHCAGSDSLLTTDVFLTMLNGFFMNADVLAHAGTIVDLA